MINNDIFYCVIGLFWWVGDDMATSLLDSLVFFSAENSSDSFNKRKLIPRNESKICSFVTTVEKN